MKDVELSNEARALRSTSGGPPRRGPRAACGAGEGRAARRALLRLLGTPPLEAILV